MLTCGAMRGWGMTSWVVCINEKFCDIREKNVAIRSEICDIMEVDITEFWGVLLYP